MTLTVFWDFFRFLDIVLWALGFAIALRVMILYAAVYTHRHDDRERRKSAGLLPLHVWVIAMSWLLLSASAASSNIAKLGEPFTLLIPLNLLGFSLGLAALVIIMRYERRRVNPPDPRVQNTTTVPQPEGTRRG